LSVVFSLESSGGDMAFFLKKVKRRKGFIKQKWVETVKKKKKKNGLLKRQPIVDTSHIHFFKGSYWFITFFWTSLTHK
jgi:hypothetical protein